MEGLRQISQSAFKCSQKFIKAENSQKFASLEFSHKENRGPDAKRRYLVETELSDWIRPAVTDATTKLRLKIVCLATEPDTSLKISRDVFSNIMINMRVDPGVLYLICHARDGFHFFPGSPESDGPALPTWFIGTSRYAMLWTFHEKKCVTIVVMIERRGNAFKGFTEVLEKFTHCICAPQVMCLVIPVYKMHFYDMRIEGVLNDMRTIEKTLGFGPRTGHEHWPGGKHDQSREAEGTEKVAIDEIMVLSQRVHETTGKIKNSDRLRRASARMLENILLANRAAAAEDNAPANHQEEYKEALRKLSEAVPVIQRRMDSNADYLAYMQYRAENLS